MPKPVDLRPKAITVYVTPNQYDQLQELIAYYSQGASNAGASSVVRFAVDMLYQSLYTTEGTDSERQVTHVHAGNVRTTGSL